MFESLPFADEILYHALLRMVKSNSGIGFHRDDQGHFAYKRGREGKQNPMNDGDSPDNNVLYQMMFELSQRLGNDHDEFSPDEMVNSWTDFCRIAADAYDAHQ
jgi:hypothetical protein